MGDVKRYECFAHEGMTEDAAGSYVRLDDYQSEKARADAADSRIAALEEGMRGLVEGWRRLAGYEDEHGELEVGDESATRLLRCADELSALLNRPADGGE